MSMTISSLSLEYVRVPVSATLAGVAIDPTSDPVSLAFTAIGSEPSVWHTGSWETDSSGSKPRYYARCLVGPGNVVLAIGRWQVHVKVTDNPEVPVLKAGELIVT